MVARTNTYHSTPRFEFPSRSGFYPSEWLAIFILLGLSFIALAVYPTSQAGTTKTLLISLFHLSLWSIWLAFTFSRWGKKPFFHFFRGFGPWVAVALCYGLMRYLVPLVHSSHFDLAFRDCEQWIWGLDASRLCANLASPSWTGFFCLLYLGVFPWLALFFLYYRLRHVELFERVMIGLLLIYMGGFLGYMAFPAEGPRYAFPGDWNWLGTGRIPALTNGVVGHMGSHLDVFPSLHAAFVVYLLLWQAESHKKTLFWAAPLAVGVWISTIYLGFHYFPDFIGGWALGVLAFITAPWFEGKLESLNKWVFDSLREAYKNRPGEVAPEAMENSSLDRPLDAEG